VDNSVVVPHLRVGLFTECYHPIRNGVVAAVDALAATLRAHGHDVVYVTPKMPGFNADSGDVVAVPSVPLPARTAYRLTVPMPSRKRREAMKQLSIVHAHSPFVTGWMGVSYARRHGVPLVFTYHTLLEEYVHYVPIEVNAARRAASELTRAYANAADAVIVPTQTMAEHLRELGVTRDIDVIPSGIDVAHFSAARRSDELRAKLGAQPGDVLVLFVGRIAREKDVHVVLEAFARLPPARMRLAIVGDGPERERLEHEAERLQIAGRTVFAGELPRDDLPGIYAAGDVFAFASRSETQGLVLVEAMAAGLPIAALDSAPTREVLGGAGVVVAGGAAELAAAIVAALSSRDPARSRAVAANYERDLVGVRVIEVYERVVTALHR
jgi:glycosyltransferase involved in cell wall biosynthesis